MWRLLGRQFASMFSVLLLVAGLLSLVTFAFTPNNPIHLYVAIMLLVIVVVMALASFYQERKAIKVKPIDMKSSVGACPHVIAGDRRLCTNVADAMHVHA